MSERREAMFSVVTLLILRGIFYSLHLKPGGGSFPKPLSAADEKKYLELMKQGDKQARDILIERNLRLVAHIIKKYYTGREDQDDLISIGTIGLIKGISSFDPTKGVRLATYASKCIENEILMHFRSQKRVSSEVLLSDAIDTDKDGNSLSLLDVISVDDNMLEELNARDTSKKLRSTIDSSLTKMEADIIKMRYGLNNTLPKTQHEIAQHCGISRSYVSRIEKKAVEKLRHSFETVP